MRCAESHLPGGIHIPHLARKPVAYALSLTEQSEQFNKNQQYSRGRICET